MMNRIWLAGMGFLLIGAVIATQDLLAQADNTAKQRPAVRNDRNMWARTPPDRLKPNYVKPTLTSAIVRPDNDIGSEKEPGDTVVPLPRAVEQTLHAIARRVYDEHVKWVREHPEKITGSKLYQSPWFAKLKEVYGPVFLVAAPHGRQLYVFTVLGQGTSPHKYLVLFEPKTGRITKRPQDWIDARWEGMTESFNHEGGFAARAAMQKPLVTFDDLNQDGEPDLVIQEQYHNGTHTSVLFHYFVIKTDLSLVHLLVFESQVLGGGEEIDGQYFPVLYRRTLQKLSPNRVKLIETKETATEPIAARPLCEVVLESRDAASPFEMKPALSPPGVSVCDSLVYSQ